MLARSQKYVEYTQAFHLLERALQFIMEGVIHMTICPIALAVGCKKCPAFKFCPLTTVLGDQQKEDEVDSSNDVSKWREKDWEEKFPPEKNKNGDAGEE